MKLPASSLVAGATLAALAAWPASGAGSAITRAALAPPAPIAARALLLDVARAGERLVAVGAHGIIVTSDDHGTTWSQASVPAIEVLTAISIVDLRIGWAVGHGGTVLRSGDAGRTWERLEVPVPPETSLLDVLALDARHVIAVGAYEVCLETRDGGHTWAVRKAFGATSGDDEVFLNRITRGNSGRLYLAGEFGTLAVSDNQGATWRKFDAPYEGSFYGLHELARGRLLAHGLRGRAFTSDDRGASWQQVEIPHEVLLMTAAEARGGLVVMAGLGGHLFVSRDGASSFRAEKPDLLTGTAEVAFAADGALICVGDTGAHRLELPLPRP